MARLHNLFHKLKSKQVPLATFMAGREPAIGTPGAIIYGYMVNAVFEPGFEFEGHIDCIMFDVHLASQGHGEELLKTLFNDVLAENDRELVPIRVFTHQEAIAFTNALQRTDVVNMPRESIRCMHCWADFDKPDEGIINEPLQLPCHPSHMLGRDCLIAVLTTVGSKSPLCFVDMATLVPDASQTQRLRADSFSCTSDTQIMCRLFPNTSR
jgi:hypothetical protein